VARLGVERAVGGVVAVVEAGAVRRGREPVEAVLDLDLETVDMGLADDQDLLCGPGLLLLRIGLLLLGFLGQGRGQDEGEAEEGAEFQFQAGFWILLWRKPYTK
jgi:hypothetical protein